MIHQIEKGSKKPSYRQLKAIAQALEVPVSDLTDETPACQGVTNNANGDHQVVYQHVERLALMTEEFQVMLRQVVTEVVNARCEQLLEEMQQRFPMLQDAPSDDHAQEEGGP
jgi:transcriptional regulator with XRE-family HTH domain